VQPASSSVSGIAAKSRARCAALILGALAVFACTGRGFAQGTSAAADYAQYCARCHGADGHGHGPAVEAIPGYKPADLTALAKNNGGKFPTDEVRDIIDGRKMLPGHNDWSTDMPLFGLKFQPGGKEFTSESERQVKARIEGLVDYIRTMQASR
jgi:hypothetical protein